MIIKNYFIIGVMSGTSLDGIDLAYVHFTVSENDYSYKIVQAQTIPYSDLWTEKLKQAINLPENELHQLNKEYTLYLSETIANFITQHQIKQIDAIGSHGHTIKHQPNLGFTLQIGNLPEIKQFLPYPIVCDFRVQDVALGGQGAPLVPIGDLMLFTAYDYCLNLGGFANVSFTENNRRIAFDLCPVNTVLNYYANKIGLPYDDKGAVARSGQVNFDLLHQLNAIPFYTASYPKSLGIEFVMQNILPLLNEFNIPIADKLRTFTEHVAYQICQGLPQLQGSLLVTGGGAYNDFLLELIQKNAQSLQVLVPDNLTVEFKEALLFGFLALRKLENKTNVLASVTGAKYDHSSGVIYS
ncbi:anhydro-N-acetylmuramic acid kinase [Flavobacterium agricola]|uniref:Anhydro-N-acetylmuramic acid kinase n=1 Tax=Flavobacterium agricola TaxID=2870839 RepID=A0ABY6M230_9FLAO|nr:anhydro-N-acetylmuramic acid kinase [Flavobacterium agricola]UYW01465.1 anhydro-N-acetylmuramic acid kinase [Flavobacterium agricola]